MVNSIEDTVDHCRTSADGETPLLQSAPQGGELKDVPKERHSPSGLFSRGGRPEREGVPLRCLSVYLSKSKYSVDTHRISW